jgi:glycosyltransferase involved in cell wall biosynthesis
VGASTFGWGTLVFVQSLHVGLFTECYRPIVNGIVASIDALRGGLRASGVDVTTIAPGFPHFADAGDDIVRIPSLPLPTPTDYRLCVPYLRAGDRMRMRKLDVVHTHSPFVTGWMGANYARRRGLPLVFTYHTRLEAYAHYVPMIERRTLERAAETLTRAYANVADAVVVPTDAMLVRLRELGVTSRIAVVASAIDVAAFAAGRRSAAVRALLAPAPAAGAADDGGPLALVVSRLAREKNLEAALVALGRTRTPGLRLAIVGDGPHRAALEAFAAACGVADRVRFVGALPREALPDVYASADAFVFPSTTETQGLVIAEAQAAGLRVVAADTPAMRETVGRGGVVVPAEPAAFATALDAALAAGRDESAVHLAQSRFSVETQTRQILDLYREVLAAKAA